MNELHKIVKKKLEEKYNLIESFKQISLMEDENDKLDNVINVFGGLIDEGYSNEEIETVIEEQFDWFKKMFNFDNSTKDNFISNAKGAGISQVKEFIITKVLQMLGLKGKLAKGFATAISEMNITDIISVFRSKQGCMVHSDVVAKGIIEGIARMVIEDGTEETSIIGGYLRNLLSEYMYKSGMDRKIGQMICSVAYGNNSISND